MRFLILSTLMLCVVAQKGRASEHLRGDYLIEIAGCVACHTAEETGAKKLAGGRAIATPYGRIFSSNITPSEDGIGNWTYAQFERALRHGQSPKGFNYYPVFPFTSYRALSDDDVLAIYQALQKQTPVQQTNTAPELRFPFNQRGLLALWRLVHFDEVTPPKSPPASDSRDHERYLVEALLHCSECHTPRDAVGGLRARDVLSGAHLPSGHWAPSLRPSRNALAAWGEEDIAEYLATGRSDYTRKARDEMKEFIDCCTSRLNDDDRAAVARYLRRLPRSELASTKGPRAKK